MLCRARSGLTLTFEIPEREAFIGRERGAAVSVPVEGVSRRHARLRWDGRSHWIEDLKSTNGTFLNGEIVRESRLRHLDVVTLGKAVDLVFVVRGEGFKPVTRQGIVGARLIGEGEEHEIPVGELTLGRSEACNVICEGDAISKLHARIERTADQLVLQDLGSANGTLVNGVPITRAVLRHGDEVSLAGGSAYRVDLQLGEVTSRSGFRIPAGLKEPTERPRLSEEWKTRFDWSSTELEEIAAFHRQVAEEEKARRRTLPPPPPERTARRRPAPSTPTPRPPAPPAPAGTAKKPEPERPAPTRVPLNPVRATSESPRPDTGRALRTEAPPRPPTSQPPTPARGAPGGPSLPKPDDALIPPGLARPERERRGFPRPATGERPRISLPGLRPLPRSTPDPAPQAPSSPKPAPPATPAGERSRQPSPPPVRRGLPRHPAEPNTLETTMPIAGVAGKLIEVRLTGGGFDLVASETGPHGLGRATDAALRVRHPTVSRRHARIVISDDREMAYLQNAGGANGTLLNGREIERIEPLQHGDRVQIGDVVLEVSLKRL
jgi:pSer/pThr/pTyr-binding forkhead associated (FHA) protein